MKETTTIPLQVPEIALAIISHLNPHTVLSIRLVSSQLNALILTHQKSINKSIIQRHFSDNIDWYPPELDCPLENFHLKTLTRLPKAYELARRANKNYDCYSETRQVRNRKKKLIFTPTPSYPAFLARCACAILIIWTLNDMRRHIGQSEPPPKYISPPPPPKKWQKLGRLFPRIKNIMSKTDAVSSSPVDANDQNILLYKSTLAPRQESEVRTYLSTFRTLGRAYLNSLPQSHRTDQVWVLNYLMVGLPRTTCRHNHIETGFALQQDPSFILSWCSKDPSERLWAQSLARQVIEKRKYGKHGFWLEDWEVVLFLLLQEGNLFEEAERAKEELTRGDWRHEEHAALETR